LFAYLLLMLTLHQFWNKETNHVEIANNKSVIQN
jgi:hypothetical protein